MTVILSYYPAMASFWFVFPGNGEGCGACDCGDADDDRDGCVDGDARHFLLSVILSIFPLHSITVARLRSNDSRANHEIDRQN